MSNYRQTTLTPTTELPSNRSWTPRRAPEVAYDYSVPLKRSQTTALIVALLIAFIVLVIDTQLRMLDWQTVVKHTLLWGVGTFLPVWLLTWFRESKIVQNTLYVVEDFTGLDLNRDGMRGKPNTRYVLVRGNKQQEISSQEDQLVQFVRECFSSGRSGMDYWASKGMSRQQYEEFRDLLSRGGYIRNKGISKRAGWVFKNGLTADDVIDGLFSNER